MPDSAGDNFSPSDADLALFITGGCTPREAQRIERWIGEGDRNRGRIQELRLLLREDGSGEAEDVEALWNRVRVRTIHAERMSVVNASRPKAVRPAAPGRRGLPAWKPRRVAVVVALFVIGSGLTIMRVRAATTVAVAPAPPAASFHDYTTGRGEHATVLLADGSQVTLAPESRLRVPASFGNSLREVEIEGEAVLDVVHDGAHPFRVHAGGAVAEDIGTRFDIRRYGGERSVTVAVAEGAVSLGKGSPGETVRTAEGILVKAGGVARLEDGGRVAAIQGARAADYFGWTRGALVFTDVPMEAVRETLDRWFAAQVQIDDRLKARRVTARFAGQSERSFIDALATTLDAEVEWHGAVVTLRARP